MNPVIRWDLFGQILDFEPDHFRNRGLPAPAELIHIGDNDGVETFAGKPMRVFSNSENADFFDERRLRVVGLEFFGINILSVREHNYIFAAAGDGESSF